MDDFQFNPDEWEEVPQEQNAQAEFNPDEWDFVPQKKGLKNESFLGKLPRNIAAGIAQGSYNDLRGLSKNIGEQGNKFGEMINKGLNLEKYGIQQPKNAFSLNDYLPQRNFAEMLGQKGVPTNSDIFIQNLSQYLPDVLLAGNALRHVLPHLTKRGASKSLRAAKELGIKRNIAPLDLNPELVEDLRQYLPADTLPYRNLMEGASSGDYQKLFDLQSEIGREAGARSKDWFSPAQRAFGRAGLQSRNALLEDMHRALKEQGNLDISDLLRKGQNEYRRYMAFRPYRNALGVAAVGAALPKNSLVNLGKKIVSIKK